MLSGLLLGTVFSRRSERLDFIGEGECRGKKKNLSYVHARAPLRNIHSLVGMVFYRVNID